MQIGSDVKIMSQGGGNPTINVSPFHLIFWIFLLDDDQLSEEQILRIKRMYGDSNFDPIPRCLKTFKQIMESIHLSNNISVAKVVTNESMARKIIQNMNENEIINVFVYCPNALPDASLNIDDINIFMGGDINYLYSGYIFDLDQTISRAEAQVQQYTKSFRTFNNAQLLLSDEAERINKYRYKLVSFIKLKVSDYKTYVEKFKDFVKDQLVFKNMKSTQPISIMGVRFNDYLQYSKQFMKEEQLIAKAKLQNTIDNKDNIVENLIKLQKNQQQYRIKFYGMIIRLYQKQDFFYQLMNTSLRALNQGRLDNWEALAIPFYQLYSAIKHLYKKKVKDEIEGKFYTSNFTVYRGGRIRKSQYQDLKQYQSKIFIELFGFTSTSLKLQTVIEKFLKAKGMRDLNKDMENDESCIFKIQATFNKIMAQQKYDFLVHGFYKFDSLIENEENQNEVLFGPLNIFQLVKVQKKTVRQFLQQQKQTYPESEKYGNTQIVVVYLKFGSFFDILLDDNPHNLSEEKKMAKNNYIFCMNSINKYAQFDFADFYQLNRQLSESYKYLQKKVGGEKEQDQFLISLLDNKNYFARISQICLKQGKNKQALSFNKMSIKCYEQLESINLKSIYNSHYQNLFNMKMTIIQFYQENSNYIAADLQFENQLKFIQSKQFKEANGKLRHIQTIINQGVNNFSIGKINQSISQFTKCSEQIKKISEQIIPALYNEKNCCLQYLKNIFCCGNGGIIWSCCIFSDYYHKKQQQTIKDFQEKRKDITSTESKIGDLLKIVKDALCLRMKVFKKQEQYEYLIKQCNKQIKLQINKRRQNKNYQKNIENQLKQIQQKVSNTDISDSKYELQFNSLCTKFKQLKNQNNLRLYAQSSLFDATQAKYIQEFIRREKEKRKIYEEKRREEVLKRNQKDLIQFYIKCYQQIDEELNNLKKECYDESTTRFLKGLNEKARLKFMSHNYQQALHSIEKIELQGRQKGQDRNYELAMAYMTKTRILSHSEQYEQAVESVIVALKSYQRSVNNVYVNESSQDRKIDNPQVLQVLKHRNEYLELKNMKARCFLYYIHDRRKKKGPTTSNIFVNHFSREDSWKQQSDSNLLIEVSNILEYLNEAIKLRSSLQNISQISADLKQINSIYMLIQTHLIHSTQAIDDAFKMLDECFLLRDTILGPNNSVNFLTCSEIIFKFHNDRKICKRIQQHKYLGIINRAYHDFQNCHFYWKVAKAYYLIENARGQKGKAIEYLKRAILHLEKQKDPYLVKQKKQLEQELRKWEDSQRPPENDLQNKNKPSTAIAQTNISKGLTSFDCICSKQNSLSAVKYPQGENFQMDMDKKEDKESKPNQPSIIFKQDHPSSQQLVVTSSKPRHQGRYLQPINSIFLIGSPLQ